MCCFDAATFKCGHPRNRDNMSFSNDCPICKQCLAARQRAYRAAHPQQRSDQRHRLLLTASVEARPHLYPSKQAA